MYELLAFCLIPLIICLLSLFSVPNTVLRKLVPILMWGQLAAVIALTAPVFRDANLHFKLPVDFGLDHLSAAFVVLTNVVAASSLSHATVFFTNESKLGNLTVPKNENWFYFYAALFLCAMDFVFLSENLGFMWISIEATTLFSAALVYYGRDKHALEATWKYLIVCSVGIAFALLGTILFFAASQHFIPAGTLDIRLLTAAAKHLQPKFVQLGYVFCLLGYGTKAGLFPLHTWLPDAHSEAPAPASAMLSGSLLNCALFAICRLTELVKLTDYHTLATNVPIFWGALTTFTSTLFLVNQIGIKRLWAYSSIENVGIMLSAIGLGAPSLFLLQAINHSIAKVALFLLSGNIIQLGGTKELSKIRGVLKSSPACALALILAAAAVTGMPPFGSFVVEWLILMKAMSSGQILFAICLMASLALGFIAVSVHVCNMVLGTPKHESRILLSAANVLIPLLLCCGSLFMGVTGLTQEILGIL
ncbi:MAG: hypothetical protein EKK48_22575 [Candidatus Melainabacteria bacterium]|nr:MAG: hypothetical protein EKK48_22575 [Candidatus Melainabacteria bacterium]